MPLPHTLHRNERCAVQRRRNAAHLANAPMQEWKALSVSTASPAVTVNNFPFFFPGNASTAAASSPDNFTAALADMLHTWV